MFLPMHGEAKLRTEGLRTRDAHIMQWIANLSSGRSISVISRPEPWPRLTAARLRGKTALPDNWNLLSAEPFAVPNIGQRRLWWAKSRTFQPALPEETSTVIAWNPLAAARACNQVSDQTCFLLDLLDDWLIHPAFAPIRREVYEAYETLFARVDFVTANSEGTQRLAHDFGRTDVVLIPNGCDPERFSQEPKYQDRIVVGYGGKVGGRVDVRLFERASARFPDVVFEIAGPVLERGYKRQLSRIPGVRLIGDIRYDDYPQVLQGWDIGWIPHKTGKGEVGGDAIKVYEYRAAGLPTLMTPIIGASRAPAGVTVVDSSSIVDALGRLIASRESGHIPRLPHVTPVEHTWQEKSRLILQLTQTKDAGL